eukprot:403346537
MQSHNSPQNTTNNNQDNQNPSQEPPSNLPLPQQNDDFSAFDDVAMAEAYPTVIQIEDPPKKNEVSDLRGEISESITIFDKKYKKISRFGEDKVPLKMVFLVSHTKTDELLVLKLFTRVEQWGFKEEVEVSLKVDRSSLRQVLIREFVGFDTKKEAVLLCGELIEEYAYIILPYCEHGSIIDLLVKANNLNLIDRNFLIKLIDYGHARKSGVSTNQTTGTDRYMAPEILYKCTYLPEKADIFNLGVFLYILMFQHVPFDSAHKNDCYYRYVFQGRFQEFFTREYITSQARIPLVELNVIWSSLNPQACQRPSITDLMNSPFVRQLLSESMIITDDLKKEILSILYA